MIIKQADHIADNRRRRSLMASDGEPNLHLGAPGPSIPVRIHIDEVAPDVVLSAGMTATVEIDD